MVRYFLLRSKQFLRMLVWVIAASVLLGLCAAGAGTALIRQEAEGESQQKYRVALCGITDDPLLQLGITALQTFDETRHSVVLTTMQEPDAVQALEAGTLNAYVVIPEGFLTSALQGDVKTLRYVTAPGGTAVAKLFESEITAVIGQILLTAQKGSYGGYFALADNGAEGQALAVLNELCLEYIELAFLRTRLYSVQTLGVGNGLELTEYLTCGLAVCVIFLLSLPFIPISVQTDVAVNRMLAARGCPAWVQACVDLGCLLLGVLISVSAVLLLPIVAGVELCVAWGDVLPVVFLATVVGFFICSLARDVISAVCLQFLVVIAMCFVSGCLYPAYFLPMMLRNLAAWLPTGLCRVYLTGCVTGADTAALGWILVAGILLAAAAVGIRSRRIRQAKGAA